MSVTNPKFKCFTCDSRFAEPKDLIKHISTVHVRKKLHKCTYCSMTFSDELLLEEHDINVHERKKTFKCLKCSDIFPENLLLEKHISTVHKENLQNLVKPQLCAEKLVDKAHTRKNQDTSIHEKKTFDSDLDLEDENENSFDCPKCPAELSSKNELAEHILSHKQETDMVKQRLYTIPSKVNGKIDITQYYKCTKCNLGFEHYKYLQHHNSTVHEGKKLIQCPKCDSNFTQSSGLRSHLVHVHNETEPYICEHCNAKFANFELIKEHINSIHPKVFNCSICSSGFPTKTELSKHLFNFHDKKEEGTCPICHKVFDKFNDRFTLVKNHILIVHEGKKPYTCHICNAGFASRLGMKAHITRVHDEKRFDCTFCKTKIPSRKSLLKHIDEVHDGKKPNLCDFCSSGFIFKCNLEKHCFKVHRRKDNVPHCEVCIKNFSSNVLLKKHIKIIHEAKNLKLPHVCSYCEKSFSEEKNLKRHIVQNHVNHQCPHCDKPFLSQTSLNEHIVKIHSGKKVLTHCKRTRCGLKYCSYSGRRGFYKIPEHPIRRKSWIEACKFPTDVKKSTQVCWKHFNKEDFQNEMVPEYVDKLGMGLLKKLVVPSQNLPTGILDFSNDVKVLPKLKTKYENDYDIQESENIKINDINSKDMKIKDKLNDADRKIEFSHGCYYCDSRFSNESDLKEHFLSIHANVKCPNCDDQFWSRSALKRHIIEIHSGKNLQKSICRVWYCGIKSCQTSAKRGFYRIPEHPLRRQDWINACNFPHDVKKSTSICWKHFKKEDFQTEMDPKKVNELGMGSLKKFVVPSQNLPSGTSDDFHRDLEDTFLDGIDQNQKASAIENGKVCRKLQGTKLIKNYEVPTLNLPTARTVPNIKSNIKLDNLPKTTKTQTHWNNKKFIEKGMIFCLTCGNFYRELQELSIHIEKEPKCKTKANLSFLSSNEAYIKNIHSVKVENNEIGVFQSFKGATEDFEKFEDGLQDPLAV